MSMEIPSDDYIKKWTEDGINQLFDFMESFQPNLQTTKTNDPFILAQQFQHTMDKERDPYFRKIMGNAGEETLNKLIPKQITYRLSLVTDRLIVLTMRDDGLHVDDYRTNTFVTGELDEFVFEDTEKTTYAEKDRLSVKLIRPEFLFPRSSEFRSGAKPTISVNSASKYAIPVESVRGRLFDPEM